MSAQEEPLAVVIDITQHPRWPDPDECHVCHFTQGQHSISAHEEEDPGGECPICHFTQGQHDRARHQEENR